jgi:hypothetical protein
MGQDNECNKKRISNIEQGMSNAEATRAEDKLHPSIFIIRYSLRPRSKFIILELPTAEGLAEHLQKSFAVLVVFAVHAFHQAMPFSGFPAQIPS